jgi:hypothetical protein
MWWIMRAWESASRTSAAFFTSARSSARAAARANTRAEQRVAATALAEEVRTALHANRTNARASRASRMPKAEPRHRRGGEGRSPGGCRSRAPLRQAFPWFPALSLQFHAFLGPRRSHSPSQLCRLTTRPSTGRMIARLSRCQGLRISSLPDRETTPGEDCLRSSNFIEVQTTTDEGLLVSFLQVSVCTTPKTNWLHTHRFNPSRQPEKEPGARRAGACCPP